MSKLEPRETREQGALPRGRPSLIPQRQSLLPKPPPTKQTAFINNAESDEDDDDEDDLQLNDLLHMPNLISQNTAAQQPAQQTDNQTIMTTDGNKDEPSDDDIDTIQTKVEKSASTKNSKKLTQYTLQMLNFIPPTILLQLSQEPLNNLGKLPLIYKTHSCVLVCELRNFYDIDQLNTVFADIQTRNEHLQSIANDFLECLMSVLSKYGGDLIQFLGRSCIAQFTQTADMKEISARAASCALEIIKECEKFLPQPRSGTEKEDETYGQNQIIPVCGIGSGEVQVLHVGGTLQRVEFFVAGEALMQALLALRQSDEGYKQVCVSTEIWQMIKDNFEGHQIKNLKENLTYLSPILPKVYLEDPRPEELVYYFITKTKTNLRSGRDIFLQKLKNSEDVIRGIQLQLKYYIPGAYRHLSQVKSSETRFCQHSKHTVIAVAVEINTNEKRKKRQLGSLRLIQNFITVIQAQVYKMQGSITKIISYESGLIVLATWGMQFMNHMDDCSRAVYAALNIKKHLTGLQLNMDMEEDDFVEPPVHIGISTGDILQCVVGNQQRREIIGVGEAQERAIALLQAAMKKYSRIYVDFLTRQLASHEMDFEYIEHLELPNKVLNIAVFQPLPGQLAIDKVSKNDLSSKEVVNQKATPSEMLSKPSQSRIQSRRIRLNANPFFIDRENFYSQNFSEAYGRQETVARVIADIQEYVQNFEQSHAWVVAIKGRVGSGKSLFARKVLLDIAEQEKEILKPVLLEYPQLHFEFLVCNNDSNKQTMLFGPWRGFLQHLLEVFAKDQDRSKETIINTQIQHTPAIGNKTVTIQEIFGLEHLAKRQHSAKQHQEATSFMQENYDSEYEEIVLGFCQDFILHALELLRQKVCYFLVVDNADTMNLSSWRLFDFVQSRCRYLVIMACFQCVTHYFEELPGQDVSCLGFQITADQQTQNFYKQNIKPQEDEIFSVAEMNPINKESLEQALKGLSSVYERTANREIEDMTKIINTKTNTKTYKNQEEIRANMLTKYQVHQHFSEIESELLDTLLAQSQGSPMTAFEIIYQQILQGAVVIEKHKLQSVPQHRDREMLNLPFFVTKQQNVFLETALKKAHSRVQKLSNLMTVQLLSILGSASVIGEYFTHNMLENCESISKGSDSNLAEILRDAESRDLIELIMMDETTGDMIYRFTNPQLRITLYQMQSFTFQKKEGHQSIIRQMQNKIVLDYTNQWSLDEEANVFQRHLLKFERVAGIDALSPSSRQQLQIKRINLSLEKKRQKLKQGALNISFDSSEKKQFQLVLTPQQVQIFKETSGGKSKKYGFIELKQVIKVATEGEEDNLPLEFAENQEEPFQFDLHVSNWHKSEKMNDLFEPQKAEIISLTPTQDSKKLKRECEDWMTAIEYIRTKYQFDQFTQKYGGVAFKANAQSVAATDQNFEAVQTVEQKSFLLTKALLERQPASRTLLKSLSVKNPSATHKVQNEKSNIPKLVEKIKSLYTVSCVQFFDHLGDSDKPLGQVNPQYHQHYANQCKVVGQAVLEHSVISESAELLQTDNSQSQFSQNQDSSNTSPRRNSKVLGLHNLLDQRQIPFEDHKVHQLGCLNVEWREGQVIPGPHSVSQTQAETQGFKLLKRFNASGYNKEPSPFKPQPSFKELESHLVEQPQNPRHRSKNASITDQQTEVKLPTKNRKSKAEAIQKILENKNTEWYTNYTEAAKNRPRPPSASSSQHSSDQQLTSLKHVESAGGSIAQLKQSQRSSHVLKAGGLTQSLSHLSIGQSQIDLQSSIYIVQDSPSKKNVPTGLRRSTLKSMNAANTASRPLIKQLNFQDSIAENAFDQSSHSSSKASFKDYQETSSHKSTPRPDKHPDAIVSFYTGCPVTITSDSPQYITHDRTAVLKLKKGSVVYLSEELTDAAVVKCHTYVNGAKVDIVMSRHDLQLLHDSRSELSGLNQKEKLQRLSAERLHDLQKNVASRESLLSHQEASVDSKFLLYSKPPQQTSPTLPKQQPHILVKTGDHGPMAQVSAADGHQHEYLRQETITQPKDLSQSLENGLLNKFQQRKARRMAEQEGKSHTPAPSVQLTIPNSSIHKVSPRALTTIVSEDHSESSPQKPPGGKPLSKAAERARKKQLALLQSQQF